MIKTRKHRVFATIASILALSAVGGATAGSASAANGGVYVVLPTWLGNCPAGGSPTGVWGTTGPYGELWATPPSGDHGDNIVWATVRLAATNTFTFKAFCSRPWYRGGNYWGAASQQTAYVSRAGQTVFTGPWGARVQ